MSQILSFNLFPPIVSNLIFIFRLIDYSKQFVQINKIKNERKFQKNKLLILYITLLLFLLVLLTYLLLFCLHQLQLVYIKFLTNIEKISKFLKIKKKKGKKEKGKRDSTLCNKYILMNFKTMCTSYVIQKKKGTQIAQLHFPPQK